MNLPIETIKDNNNFISKFKIPGIAKEIIDILNTNNFDKSSMIGQIVQIGWGEDNKYIIEDYDIETNEYKCFLSNQVKENKKNKNIYYHHFKHVEKYINDVNLDKIEKLINKNVLIGSCYSSQNNPKYYNHYKIIRSITKNYVYYDFIDTHNIPSISTHSDSIKTSFNDKNYIDYLKTLKETDDVEFEIIGHSVYSDYNFENNKLISCDNILSEYFTKYLNMFNGKEIKYKLDKDYRDDDDIYFYTNDLIVNINNKYSRNSVNIINKDKDGNFINGKKKEKIPKRGVQIVDINFVFNTLCSLINQQFKNYFKITDTDLEKYRPSNNQIIEKIEENDKSASIMKDLLDGKSVYIDYLSDLPDEILEEFATEYEIDDYLDEDAMSDILGNTTIIYSDFEPYGDAWDYSNNGNDSEYYYRNYAASTKNYLIEITTGSYIKDQIICNPRGITQFKITKI